MIPEGIFLKKGEEIGLFRMGSSIAIVFECPENYKFKYKPNSKVIIGQELPVKK